MDDLDHQLIGLLRQDSRLPVASLAAATGVSRATVKARIDRLVENGTIEAFTIRLGAELRHAEVRAIVLIEVEGKAADHVAQRLRGVPEVRALYSTNGRWDFVVDSQGLMKSAVVARFARAASFGMDKASAREPAAARFYDVKLPVPRALHAVVPGDARHGRPDVDGFGHVLARRAFVEPALTSEALVQPLAPE